MIKSTYNSSILGQKRGITLQKPNKNKIDLAKQNAGIMPNITHTLDAANISLVIVDCLNIQKHLNNDLNIELITIHDCFGCQSNYTELVKTEVKLAFIKLYADTDFVKNYHDFILEYLKKSGFYLINNNKSIQISNRIINIPEMPVFNYSFDLKENLLSSIYFIN
jgi:DNA-directed RNA polymerase